MLTRSLRWQLVKKRNRGTSVRTQLDKKEAGIDGFEWLEEECPTLKDQVRRKSDREVKHWGHREDKAHSGRGLTPVLRPVWLIQKIAHPWELCLICDNKVMKCCVVIWISHRAYFYEGFLLVSFSRLFFSVVCFSCPFYAEGWVLQVSESSKQFATLRRLNRGSEVATLVGIPRSFSRQLF